MFVSFAPTNPPEVFISYAHEDEDLLEKFEPHLADLERRKIIRSWYGRKIFAGEDWEEQILEHLNTAEIFLMLVSIDFLISDYCNNVEFERAMERQKVDAACVIPVILRPCHWKKTLLGKFQALPKGAGEKPVVRWDNIEDAFVNITDGITEAVKRRERNNHTITKITITIEDSSNQFILEQFKEKLRDDAGVDLDRITISIKKGSIKLVIEGDSKELARIVNAFDSEAQNRLLLNTRPKSISYVQDRQQYNIAIGVSLPKIGLLAALIRTLKDGLRAFPLIKYALVVAGIALVVAIVAGIRIDYKIAVLGSVLMFALMFGLVWLSSIVHSAPSIRRLLWILILLTASTSLSIVSGYFFSWPMPLEAYVHLLQPTPGQGLQIIIDKVPPYDPVGGPNSKGEIAGRVLGAESGDYVVVIYSRTSTWYVQPTTAEPRTEIGPDGSWGSDIQTGTHYAVLLVPRSFQPPATTSSKPIRLNGVITSIEVEGKR